MRRTTVLVVDDEVALRRTVRRALVNDGYDVIEAANGHEALAVLRDTPAIGLVVSDVLMPDADGVELATALRRHVPFVPLIAMTGGGSVVPGADLRETMSMLGAAATLAKPFSVADLLACVRDVLTRPPMPPAD
jgi:DNA-binding NtrC family response regulator